jgi:FG-GAP-like repeat
MKRYHFPSLLITLLVLGSTPSAFCKAKVENGPVNEAGFVPKAAQEFLLDGPVLLKVNRRAKDLMAEDFNGDGLVDLAVIANEKSYLELYLQKKDATSLEDRFEKKEILLDRIIRDCVPVDFNGDGRVDLVLAAAPNNLMVMYQDDEGNLAPPEETTGKAARLVLGDLTGDGRDDLLVYENKQFNLYPSKRQGIDTQPLYTFFTSGDPASEVMIMDFDGDGRNDIVFHNSERFEELVVRLQSPTKTFPSEFKVGTSVMRYAQPWSRGEGDKGCVTAIHNTTRGLFLQEMKEKENKKADQKGMILSDLQIVPFDPEMKSSKLETLVTDVDGDGRSDVLIYAQDWSAMRLYRQDKSGALSGQTIPTFEGIWSVQPFPVEAGKPTPLVLFSREEKVIGYTVFDKENETLPFPKILPVQGEPKGVSLVTIKDQTVLLVMGKGGKEGTSSLILSGFPLGADGSLGEALKNLVAEKDQVWTKDVLGLKSMDINKDGREDLLVFNDFKPATLLLQSEEGKFTALNATSSVLNGLLTGTSSSKINEVLLSTDKKATSSVLVVKEKFARVFHLDEDQNVMVEHQFNGSTAGSRLTAASVGSVLDKKSREVVLMDRANDILTVWKHQKGSYEILSEQKLDGVDYQTLKLADLDGDGLDDVLLTASDRLAIAYTSPIGYSLETITSMDPTEEEAGYGKFYCVDLVPGGGEEIIAIEMKDNLMEFFSIAPDKEKQLSLQRLYRFSMYDKTTGRGRRNNLEGLPEPRELLAADLDDNGKLEIVGLMHDNLVIYYQVDAPEKKTEQKSEKKKKEKNETGKTKKD